MRPIYIKEILCYIFLKKIHVAVTDGCSLVLDLESAVVAAVPDASDVFATLLLFSSLSVALSTSIGSSLLSFPLAVFDASELSVDFLVAVSVDTLSVDPFVFNDESFTDDDVSPTFESLSFLFPDLVESSNSLSASTILSLICWGKRLSGLASSNASDSSFNGTPSSGIFAIWTPGA